MHAAQLCTLSGDTRSAQLAHAVVQRTDKLAAPDLMHLIAHGLSHAFAAEQPDMQL